MRKFIILILCLWWGVLTFAQNKSIDFVKQDLKKVKEIASKEQKIIFIDCYTNWCSPCKWLANNVFTLDTVATYFNRNFINFQLDMETPEGQKIARQFNVQVYPTQLFLDKNGNLVHQACGALSGTELLRLGANAISPTSNLTYLEKQVKSGNRDYRIVNQYFTMLEAACLNIEKAVSEYLGTLKSEDLARPENWEIIKTFVTNPESKEFKEIINQYSKFSILYTQDTINTMIFNVFNAKAIHLIKDGDRKGVELLKENVNKISFPRQPELLLTIDAQYFMSKNETDKLIKTSEQLFDGLKIENAELMNNIAWYVYSFSQNIEYLQKAVKWAKKAYELNPTYYTADTYACLAFETENIADAIKYEEIAIELAKAANVPLIEFEQNLKLFKANK
jgi:thioredoxin-related protein